MIVDLVCTGFNGLVCVSCIFYEIYLNTCFD